MSALHSRYYSILIIFFLFGTKAIACDTTQTVKCKTFFKNGELQTIQSFKNGQRNGVWIVKNEEGKIVLKTKYKNGKRIYQYTYQNNKIIESIDRKGKVRKVKDCGC